MELFLIILLITGVLLLVALVIVAIYNYKAVDNKTVDSKTIAKKNLMSQIIRQTPSKLGELFGKPASDYNPPHCIKKKGGITAGMRGEWSLE
jgi:flagellar basal body-associated protein FliL